MKEYIKLFSNLQSADGYVINDIPFTCTAISGDGTGNINLRCNEEDKKLEVAGDTIEIVDNGIPNDEIWYTSSDGNIVTPYSASSLPTIVSNTYSDGKGVIKFASDVTSIGEQAFRGCSGLTFVTIPDSVTNIGDYAFSGCTGLTSVTIGNNVTSIGDSAFSGCRSLTSIEISDSVTSIGIQAFYDCKGLTSVTIGNSVTNIGNDAFHGCTSLTSVMIPNSVTSIGIQVFYGCTSLPVENNLRYADTYLVGAVDKTLASYTIKDGTKWIGAQAFYGCSGLTSVTIPNSVTSIEFSAFNYCICLTSVTIPNNVTCIGERAFSGCHRLTSVTIPDSVTNIGRDAFYYCSGLNRVDINSLAAWCNINFVSEGSNPLFYANHLYLNNSEITDLVIPNSVTRIKEHSFDSCTGLTSITISSNVDSIAKLAFRRCNGLTSIVIPDSVTSIEYGAFSQCTGLTSVTIGSGVTNIGEKAFWLCTNLPVENNIRYADTYLVCAINAQSSFTIKEGTKWIGCEAFYSQQSLTSVTIPNSVISIEENAFYGCNKLTSITIPSSVTYLGRGAFRNCTGLTFNSLPNNITYVGEGAFSECNVTSPLYNSHVFAYMPSSYSGAYTIPDGIELITDEAFYYCQGLTSIVIPSSITKIGNSTFGHCFALSSITIPSTVTSVHEDSFYLGEGENETFPGSLKTITVGETIYNYDESTYFTITLGNGTQVELHIWDSIYCFLPDTQITLANGTSKTVSALTYNDTLKVWNFDEGHYDTASICWLSKRGTNNNHYYKLTFSDGTILKTTGKNANHHIYSTDDNAFVGVATVSVGTHVYTENGIVTITNKEYIEEECEYYNLITSRHFDCFANGILTSYGFENLYPRNDEMIFIKDERPLRPYSEFAAVGISEYWYNNLRLAEVTDSLDSIKKKIDKWERTGQPIE